MITITSNQQWILKTVVDLVYLTAYELVGYLIPKFDNIHNLYFQHSIAMIRRKKKRERERGEKKSHLKKKKNK